MTFQQLFLQGHSYDDYLAQGTETEQQAINKVTERLMNVDLPTEIQKK